MAGCGAQDPAIRLLGNGVHRRPSDGGRSAYDRGADVEADRNVDPAKIAEYAPGELQNLPGFQGGDAQKDELGGFEAYQVGGSYLRDGVKRMIAQKTVIIPKGPDLFVLQVNADGPRIRWDR